TRRLPSSRRQTPGGFAQLLRKEARSRAQAEPVARSRHVNVSHSTTGTGGDDPRVPSQHYPRQDDQRTLLRPPLHGSVLLAGRQTDARRTSDAGVDRRHEATAARQGAAVVLGLWPYAGVLS